MEITIIAMFASVATIALSFLIGSMLYKRKIKKNEQRAGEKAKLIIREAELEAENIKKDKAEIIFTKPILVAPGQSVVFYDGDTCLGGGVVA